MRGLPVIVKDWHFLPEKTKLNNIRSEQSLPGQASHMCEEPKRHSLLATTILENKLKQTT